MHKTAFDNLKTFISKHCYIDNQTIILDIGSQVVKKQDISVGSVRELFAPGIYTGVDIAPGHNVDKVYDGEKLPLPGGTADIVISTSCFEHLPKFWVVFAEMVRVTKRGGLIYLNAPSAGHVHRYPMDCYRFYPDAWKGLAEWQKIDLIEQYIDKGCYWRNNVGVFRV
jgi:SAM-dependent methyltransferase